MKRYDYRFYKEISLVDMNDYHKRVAKAAEKCDIFKFAIFKGHGYWLKELHDIIRIEFARTKAPLTNKEVQQFINELDKEFDYGRNTVFVVYEEQTR